MGESRKLYLPEELNISKMFQLFKESHAEVKVSYESYRTTFNSEFNIGFGYPRKDTCSKCDEFIVQLESIDSSLTNCATDSLETVDLHKKKSDLLSAHELHKRKAKAFYDRKSAAKERAQSSPEVEAVAFDFQKNLPIPNKTSNDVYYKRQLSFYTFNIHVLSTDEVYLYTYDETIGKKGADDVCSMLSNFITNYLPETVKELYLFCDGCSGQNKNYTVLRFIHYLVHEQKRFHLVKMSFPIRGHSYLECDRDFAIINFKTDVDLPDDWNEEFSRARKKPLPFNIINVPQEMFCAYTDFLAPRFKATCAIKTRPMREINFSSDHPNIVFFRDAWNGSFESAVLIKKKNKERGIWNKK